MISKSNAKFLANYSQLCTEYYDIDKPHAPKDALEYYVKHIKEANGPILEPMSGSGRFLIPLLQQRLDVIGFDNSPSMIGACQDKCVNLGLDYKNKVFLASFADFVPANNYKLIFIPSGSFCLLTEQTAIAQALNFIIKYLDKGGKFIFEVDLLATKNKNPGIWQHSSVTKPDGSKIIFNSIAQFDESSKIESTLCRYELWQDNRLIRQETENFKIKLYEKDEIAVMLKLYDLQITGKYQPYSKNPLDNFTETIIYECVKI